MNKITNDEINQIEQRSTSSNVPWTLLRNIPTNDMFRRDSNGTYTLTYTNGKQLNNGTSIHGHAYVLSTRTRTPTKYAIKTMDLSDKNERLTFFNELKVGKVAGIGEVGPRYYAFKVQDGIGTIIMDLICDCMDNNCNCTLKKYLSNSHKILDSDFYTKLNTTLTKFFKLTKGFHGDLHSGNIMVSLNPDWSVKKFHIIDYGSFTKFRNTAGINTINLRQLLNKINSEYESLDNPNYWWNFPSGSRARDPRKGGQLYESNKKKLEKNFKWRGANFKQLLNSVPVAVASPKPNVNGNRNKAAAAKTLSSLKDIARRRKIKGFSVYKKAQMENLRRRILNNMNRKPVPVASPKPNVNPVASPKPNVNGNRNKAVSAKTLRSLKDIARKRKIKGFSVYKKAQMENLRRRILNNMNT
jgi:tRNA A-37 threonylcarbamoyl transferase component Bud32